MVDCSAIIAKLSTVTLFVPFIMADDNNNILSVSNNNHTMVPTDDDFITELTHQMSQFMLQEEDIDDSFDFSSIASQSHNSELSWDLISSPDSTLWSPVSCNQGSSEGSSQGSSPPATPCWKTKTYANVVKGFQNNTMKHNEKAISKHNHGSDIQIGKSSNVDRFSSHKALIEEQIKAIESRKKHYITDIMQQQKQQQQHALSQKQNEAKEKEINGGNCTRPRPRPHLPRLAPLQTSGGGMMQAVFLGGSGSRSGTGVFLPRAGTVVVPSESTKNKGKGCSTVLIPARVVQALQLHFDKTAPKVVGIPPLRDLVLNHREGMFSLENHQSTKAATEVQNDMILPQEWTY